MESQERYYFFAFKIELIDIMPVFGWEIKKKGVYEELTCVIPISGVRRDGELSGHSNISRGWTDHHDVHARRRRVAKTASLARDFLNSRDDPLIIIMSTKWVKNLSLL